MLFCLILIFSIFSSQGRVEEYYIVQTKGDIIVNKSGQVLKKGDKVKAEEIIEFRPADAKAVVISSRKGTLILQKPQHPSKKDGELLYMVKSSLLSSSGTLGTRDGLISSIADLKNYLTRDNFIVLETAKISINTQAIPLSKDQYFFIRYSYQDQLINKKLEHSAPYLLIDRNVLSVDGQKIPADSCQNFTIYYRNQVINESVAVTKFTLFFPDMDNLNAEAKLIIDVLHKGGKINEYIVREVNNFIKEAYGRPSEEDFSSWIGKLL
jgi:hypothetical protein